MTRLHRYLSLAGCAIALVSCGGRDRAAGGDTARGYPVIELVPVDVTLTQEFPATIEGRQNIEVRPKIEGYVEAIFVDEGAVVTQGQKLFQIMAPQYNQEVRTAEANIRIAQAEVNTAEMEVRRIRPLVQREIISNYQLESAELNLQSRKAALTQARAQLENAKTNLGYTLITSPVNGVVGTIPYRIGSLVSGNTAQPLTTVSDISSIYAYFSINEKQALESARTLKGNTSAERIATMPPVKLILSNGQEFPHSGRIETVSGQISTSTGSLRIRATFPNPGQLVRSGSTGNVQIPVRIDSAIIIPQKSTFEIQGKRFAYVVQPDETIQSRQLGIMENNNGRFFVVEEGLSQGDKIVFEGVAALRDGLSITPRPIRSDSVMNVLVSSNRR